MWVQDFRCGFAVRVQGLGFQLQGLRFRVYRQGRALGRSVPLCARLRWLYAHAGFPHYMQLGVNMHARCRTHLELTQKPRLPLKCSAVIKVPAQNKPPRANAHDSCHCSAQGVRPTRNDSQGCQPWKVKLVSRNTYLTNGDP